jgi:hypothetical protein
MDRPNPKPIFCPFCGAHAVRFARGAPPRCDDCRAVFFVDFSRYMRRKASQRASKHISLCRLEGCNETRAVGGPWCPAHESAHSIGS